MTPLILIPARMASTRLPNKPMADICGLPMIVQVWRRAMEAEAGPVWVACDDPAIEAVIRAAGGRAVLTDPALPSGSDRIHAALARVDPEGRHDVIVNVQGDMPTIPPSVIHAVLSPLAEPSVDIATLAALIHDFKDREDPAVVKPALALAEDGQSARALYFSRSPIPHGDGPLYHHIGIYAYRRHALERFVNLPPSPLEMREKLEQLRALEAGMVIGVALVDEAPVGVDTPAHLETARTLLTGR